MLRDGEREREVCKKKKTRGDNSPGGAASARQGRGGEGRRAEGWGEEIYGETGETRAPFDATQLLTITDIDTSCRDGVRYATTATTAPYNKQYLVLWTETTVRQDSGDWDTNLHSLLCCLWECTDILSAAENAKEQTNKQTKNASAALREKLR